MSLSIGAMCNDRNFRTGGLSKDETYCARVRLIMLSHDKSLNTFHCIRGNYAANS